MAITIEDVERAIESSMEDTERADRILEALRKHNGKLLSQPIIDKVKSETGEERAYIRRQYGMCSIVFGGYCIPSDPDPGLSLLLAYTEKNVRIDADDIFRRNACYFEARRERNEARRAALRDHAALSKMATAIECINVGAGTYNSLVAYGNPLCESSTELKKLIDPDLPRVDRR
jgi:hypothetical protein